MHIKNLSAGNFERYVMRMLNWAHKDCSTTEQVCVVNLPVIIRGEGGRRYWGMIRQGYAMPPAFEHAWAMRDLQVRSNGMGQRNQFGYRHSRS